MHIFNVCSTDANLIEFWFLWSVGYHTVIFYVFNSPLPLYQTQKDTVLVLSYAAIIFLSFYLLWTFMLLRFAFQVSFYFSFMLWLPLPVFRYPYYKIIPFSPHCTFHEAGDDLFTSSNCNSARFWKSWKMENQFYVNTEVWLMYFTIYFLFAVLGNKWKPW